MRLHAKYFIQLTANLYIICTLYTRNHLQIIARLFTKFGYTYNYKYKRLLRGSYNNYKNLWTNQRLQEYIKYFLQKGKNDYSHDSHL